MSKRRRKKNEEDGRGRLLDAWTAPSGSGGPIGCLATTFTFDPAFFEEHCIGRFLDIESVPDESGAAYLLEREEKLRAHYVGVIVDRSHSSDERSLSWDLMSARVSGGCMHAKVSLLAWASAVRVIVASGNLTEPGYRSNLECFAVLDFADGAGESHELLHEVLAFLRGLAGKTVEVEARARTIGFLDRIDAKTSAWTSPKRKLGQEEVRFVSNGDVGRGHCSALATVRKEVWKEQGPPRCVAVMSPFFDRDADKTARALKDLLAQRGDTSVEFWVAARNSAEGACVVQMPKALAMAFDDVDLHRLTLESEADTRALHAKGLWLSNDKSVLWMVGSSNCTSAGMGIDGGSNIEANVAYVVSTGGDGEKQLRAALPETDDELIDRKTAIFEPAFEPGACGAEDLPNCIPVAFLAATWRNDPPGARVEVSVDASALPGRWMIRDVDERVLASSATAVVDDVISIDWPQSRPPSTLEVVWFSEDGTERKAILAVNVADQSALPLPEELRHLSLESLLDILTMSRPLHEAVARALAKQNAAKDPDPTLAELDPHRRVETDTFLLQRTKRFAHALEGLKKRLEQPVYSVDAWKHRVHGPVGPMAIAKAVEREARTDGERCFLLSEVALLLKNLKPSQAKDALPMNLIKGELQKVSDQLRVTVDPCIESLPADLRRYLERAFKEAA